MTSELSSNYALASMSHHEKYWYICSMDYFSVYEYNPHNQQVNIFMICILAHFITNGYYIRAIQ